jgi:hypothetical protein
MRACRAVEFLSQVLPFRAWRGNIIQRHIDGCPICRAKLAGRDEAGEYVIQPEAVGPTDSIWPAVEAGIRMTSPAPERHFLPVGRLLRRAAGVAAAAGVLFLLFLVVRPPKPVGGRSPVVNVEEFRLDSIEVWGKPARALFYQPRDSQIMIIWAGESF